MGKKNRNQKFWWKIEIRNALPYSSTSQPNIFDKKKWHSLLKDCKKFSTIFFLLHLSCPPAFSLHFTCCVDKELHCPHCPSQHSVCRENILISPHCYLCETAPPSAHNFSKLEPEGLIPELTIQAQKDSKVLFKLANFVLFRTKKRTSRNTWNNAVLFTMVTRTHSATAAGQLIQRSS